MGSMIYIQELFKEASVKPTRLADLERHDQLTLELVQYTNEFFNGVPDAETNEQAAARQQQYMMGMYVLMAGRVDDGTELLALLLTMLVTIAALTDELETDDLIDSLKSAMEDGRKGVAE